MAPSIRVRPYKDFLTPLLHRRFAMATAALCGLCYVEAIVIGQWNSYFWSWFPFGRAGIRTGLLFIPAFMIFILRVAQLHVGLRTSPSAWHTFRSYIGRFQVIQTIGWYFLSAYLFSEIYVWSASRDADLNRIKVIPKTDRTTLNEKPIYLTSYFFFLALAQAGSHLYFDYDRIEIPVTKAEEDDSTRNSHVVIPPGTQLKAKTFELVQHSFKQAAVVAVVSPLLYSLKLPFFPCSIRTFAWSFTRSWAKIFWHLPKYSSPPAVRPFHWELILRTVTSGFMLTLLWEVGNAAFSAYVAQEPLKNDRPITYESRDPNGSLLTGLKGKKLQTRAFAFWELVYISQRFQGRRKLIFEDIDRKGGTMWSQTLAACLEVICGIETRIMGLQPPTAPVSGFVPSQEEVSKSLPRLTKPLKNGLKEPGDIFDSPTSRPGDFAGQIAKDLGQGSSTSNRFSPKAEKAKKLFQKAEESLLTPEQRKAASPEGFVSLFKEWSSLFLNSNLGSPWRQEYRRRVASVVLGTPYGDVGIIIDAIDSLTRLAVCSLAEDKYGNVQRDVKLIIQTFTTTVLKLEAFRNQIGLHWTDVKPPAKPDSPETEIILVALKGGLHELVNAFGNYSEDLRLSQSEMRMAREASTTPGIEKSQRE